MTQQDKENEALALFQTYGKRVLSVQEHMTFQAELRKGYRELSDFGVVLAAHHIDRIRMENL